MSTLIRMRASRMTVNQLRREGVKLGSRQEGVLRSLLRHGMWPGGWVWDNYSGTQRVLDSLVKRGLVQVNSATGPAPYYTPAAHVDELYRSKLESEGG